MSVFEYFQLQELEPQEDGSISELDTYKVDDTIDLENEDGAELVAQWEKLSHDMHEDNSDAS